MGGGWVVGNDAHGHAAGDVDVEGELVKRLDVNY